MSDLEFKNLNVELNRLLTQRLQGKTHIETYHISDSKFFVTLFCMVFATDTPFTQDESTQPNTSNWTLHIAFAIKQTSFFMGFHCLFETRGRLDAIIQTIEEKPKLILFAEWESRYLSVFGKGKELEKLWSGASKQPIADAFLFTWCPLSDYENFVEQVVDFWQSKKSRRKRHPILYLVLVTLEIKGRNQFIETLEVVEIQKDCVNLWLNQTLH